MSCVKKGEKKRINSPEIKCKYLFILRVLKKFNFESNYSFFNIFKGQANATAIEEVVRVNATQQKAHRDVREVEKTTKGKYIYIFTFFVSKI